MHRAVGNSLSAGESSSSPNDVEAEQHSSGDPAPSRQVRPPSERVLPGNDDESTKGESPAKAGPWEDLGTDLLSRIAHEIRGPAGVAVSALRELEASIGVVSTEQQRWLTMLHRSNARLLSLGDLLSRSQALVDREFHLDVQKVDLRPLVASAVDKAIFLQGRSSIHVEYQTPPQPVVVETDASWSELCIQQVVNNAIRHARRTVRVTIQPIDGLDAVVVDDDGPGFSVDPLRPHQGPGDRTRSSGGGGLSLRLAHSFLSKVGGSITFGSSGLPPGRGTALGGRVSLRFGGTR